MADCRELSTLPLSQSIIDLLLQNGFRYVGKSSRSLVDIDELSLPAFKVYPTQLVMTIIFNIGIYTPQNCTCNESMGIACVFKDDLNGMKPTDLIQEINITADVAHSVSIQICHVLRNQYPTQFNSPY